MTVHLEIQFAGEVSCHFSKDFFHLRYLLKRRLYDSLSFSRIGEGLEYVRRESGQSGFRIFYLSKSVGAGAGTHVGVQPENLLVASHFFYQFTVFKSLNIYHIFLLKIHRNSSAGLSGDLP